MSARVGALGYVGMLHLVVVLLLLLLFGAGRSGLGTIENVTDSGRLRRRVASVGSSSVVWI